MSGIIDSEERNALHRLWSLGVVLLVVFVSFAGLDPRVTPLRVLFLICIALVVYAAAIWTVARANFQTRRGLAVCLVLAALWRIPLLVTPPELSDDVYRYIWDGRLQNMGIDPYSSSPSDPELHVFHTPTTRLTNNSDLPTIYPPGAQIFFRIVTMLSEDVFAMKFALTICEIATAWLLLKWLALAGKSPWWVLVFAWNPLTSIEISGGGHIDALGMLLIMASALWLRQGRSLPAVLAFTFSITVKFLPLVLIPIFWRRVKIRDVVLAGLLIIALYIPFLSKDFQLPIGSLTYYFEKWRFNGPLFGLLENMLGTLISVRSMVVLVASAGFMAGLWARARLSLASPSAWAWPMAVVLLAMPTVYPWYLLWLAPFLTTAGTFPLAVWSATVLLTYIVWYFVSLGAEWGLPSWVFVIEYGAVILALVLLWKSNFRVNRDRIMARVL